MKERTQLEQNKGKKLKAEETQELCEDGKEKYESTKTNSDI